MSLRVGRVRDEPVFADFSTPRHDKVVAVRLTHRYELEEPAGTIDAQVAAKVDEERDRIAAAEAQKAKRLVAIDFENKVKEIAELSDVLKQRDAKLAEAHQAQADLIKKQRELDDAKREMDLTIQKQVQAELGAVRDQAKQEAEAALTLRVREKEEQIASMQRQIEDLQHGRLGKRPALWEELAGGRSAGSPTRSDSKEEQLSSARSTSLP
jgi:hypothetical protein